MKTRWIWRVLSMTVLAYLCGISIYASAATHNYDWCDCKRNVNYEYSHTDIFYDVYDNYTSHKVKAYNRYRCLECGKIKDSAVSGPSNSYWEPHNFVNGVCVCGETAFCIHENDDYAMSFYWDWVNYKETYEQIPGDDQYHLCIVTTDGAYCTICNVWTRTATEDVLKSRHDYLWVGESTYGNSSCSRCGYSIGGNTSTPKPAVTPAPGACPPHTPNTERLYTTYNPINDSKHDVLIHNKVTCSACGTVIDQDKVETQWSFHNFGSGSTCLECGYNKAGYYMSVDQGHINGLAAYVGGGQGATINVTSNVEWTAVPDVNWIHINNWTGSGNGSFSVSVDANNGYAREGHILVVGTHGATIDIKVSQEGAIVNPETCSHVYGYDYGDTTDGEWQKVDNDTHKRVTLLYKDVCTICGDVRYERRPDEASITQEHTWGRTNWQDYKKRNEDEHYRTGITSCTAPGCTATKNVVETAAHVWDNRVCDVCGHEDEYDCAVEGHVDQDEDRVCDMCWEYLPYSAGLAFQLKNSNPTDGLDYLSIMETGALDSAYITGYSQYVQGLEAVGSLSVKEWIEANPNMLKFHSINMNKEHTEEIVAKIYVDYIYNYDAGDAVNKLTDEECSEMLEKIEQYIPGMTAVITTIGSGETIYETLLELDAASAYDIAFSNGLSTTLSVTTEGIDRVLRLAKASIVRRRLEQDLGGVEHLPEELQDEMNQMLDIWESELANTLELGVTALDSVGSNAIQQAMSACPILKVAHGALSVYTTTTNYDDVGAGLEDVYAIKIMTERASEAFELAFDEYQQNPTPDNYREFVKQKNTYRSYLTVGSATYRDWCIEEAPSEFDLDFWNHDKKTKARIDEANSNYEAEMNRIANYFELFD